MERYEAEHGTLTTLAMFMGRVYHQLHQKIATMLTGLALATLPAGLYLLVERVILRGDAAVVGARYAIIVSVLDSTDGCSVWVFLLLAVESIKTYRTNPNFE